MPNSVDPTHNYEFVENPEPITLYPKQPQGGFNTPISIEKAKRRVNYLAEEQFLHRSTLIWHLWKHHLGDYRPKIEDKIVDEQNQAWIVYSVQVESLGKRFRLQTVEEV